MTEYLRPRTLREALDARAKHPDWLVLAGGTDALVNANHKPAPEGVIDLWALGDILGITRDERGLAIGAATPWLDVVRSADVAKVAPILAAAAREIGALQIQARGTIGGNLVTSSPVGDSLPVLLALDAELEIATPRGTRTIPYRDFCTGYRKTALGPDELVARVHFPHQHPEAELLWRKVGTRRAQSISKVMMAAVLRIEDGRFVEARIGVGAVADRPIRARAAEAALLAGGDADAAAAALASDISPISDIRSTSDYRLVTAQNILRRFVARARSRHIQRVNQKDGAPQGQDEPDPAGSGSIDVNFSSHGIPVATKPEKSEPQAPPKRRRANTVPSMIGESLSRIPVVKEVVPTTRRGRVLARSMFFGLALVAIWIGVIVFLQLRGDVEPDLRPNVEHIMNQIRDGHPDQAWEDSSSRFQELIIEDQFVDQMKEMTDTLGDFKEVASVISTDTFHGPSGETAKVELWLEFTKGRARGRMSFLYERGDWRLIGLDVDLPKELVAEATSQEARAKRVEAPPEIKTKSETIMELIRDGHADQVWADADAQRLQSSISQADWMAFWDKTQQTIGPFSRILRVSDARKSPSGKGASEDALLEFKKSTGSVTVTAHFEYALQLDGSWKLTALKPVLPLPHGGESAPPPPQ